MQMTKPQNPDPERKAAEKPAAGAARPDYVFPKSRRPDQFGTHGGPARHAPKPSEPNADDPKTRR